MAQVIEVTPKERPNQTDSAPTSGYSKERIAREALRRGLYASGVYHDDLEFLVDGCVLALQGTGLLDSEDIPEYITQICPQARVDTEHKLYHSKNRWLTNDVAQDLITKLHANFGGKLKHLEFERTPGCQAFGCYSVSFDNTEITLFCAPAEKEVS